MTVRRRPGDTMPTAIDFDELQAASDRGLAISYHAARDPDRSALLAGGSITRTFGELDARANQLVRALRRRGVGAVDAVALLCSNRAEFVEVLAATQRAGMRLTPVNWHLTAGEVGYIVDDCDAVAF